MKMYIAAGRRKELHETVSFLDRGPHNYVNYGLRNNC